MANLPKIAQQADKILLSSAIFTGLKDQPEPGAVGICGNHIIAVGTKEEVFAHKAAHTSVIDYGEQLLMAGFCDSHIHLTLGGLFGSEADLAGAGSAQEAAQLLQEEYHKKAEQYQADEWVLGFGWCSANWQDSSSPTKEVLDHYFPDRPVFLLNSDAHGAWVNSKALAVAGVHKNTPEVACGKIFRNAQGEPEGYLSENAMSLCVKYAYSLPKDKETALIRKALPLFNQVGITAVNDMQFFFGQNMGSLQIYEELAAKGQLSLRIYFANGMFDAPEVTKAYAQKYQEGLLCHNGAKEFIDGIITTHTGLMLAPYTDDPQLNYTYQLMDLTKAKPRILELHKAGINIHLHATGDGAVRFAIDCYKEALQQNGKTRSRLSIEHCDLTSPLDWERMGRLGIIASVQPQHITLSQSLETNEYPLVVGEERCKNLWAFQSLAKQQVPLAFGTDYPLVDLDPIQGVYKAITRLFNDGGPQEGWNPEQKLSLSQALKAYTLGGAYKNGKEAVVGTLEPGKLADLIVIDENLFALKEAQLPQAKVIMTMVDGKVVYGT